MNIKLTELGRHEAWLRLSSILKAGDKHIQLERKLTSELIKNWSEVYNYILAELFKNLPSDLTTQAAEIITKRLADGLGQSFGSSEKVRAELNKYITQAYQSGKSEFAAKSDLNLPDKRAIEVLTKHNCYWLGEHYGKHIGPKIAELTQNAINDGLGRNELAEELRKALGGEVGGYKYWDVVSSAALVRSRSFGCISGMVEAGIVEYEILAMGDERMCPICGELNGQTFSVRGAQRVINHALSIDDPDKFKEAMPWHTQSPAGMSKEKLLAEGMSIPPFHGRCRCTLIMSETSEITEVNDIEATVAELREQEKKYHDEYDRLQQENNTAHQQKVFTKWQEIKEELRAIKIKAAEKGIIFATGVADKLSEENMKEIIRALKSAPEDVRKVWNIYEDQMKIISADFEHSFYDDRSGGIFFDLLKDTINRGKEPAYETFFHELGHLIDDKTPITEFLSRSSRYGLFDSLKLEVNDYINARHEKLKAEAEAKGKSPENVKMKSVYRSIEREISRLPRGATPAVSDLFAGVTFCKIHDGWGHEKGYWQYDPQMVCQEFFAEVFSESIVNPEGIKLVKRYVPKSYKIFQDMLKDIVEMR